MNNDISCTIIATVYNEASNIRPFLLSLLNQSLSPDEIIIVDGESTDGTNEILQEFENAGHIVLISKNCNISQGRNLAISHATSALIAATDAGCIVDKHWLQEITKPFHSSESPDVVAGNFEFDCQSSFEHVVVLATNNPQRTHSEESKFFPSSRSIAFTKQIWDKVKGYPEWLYAAEDTLFNIRMRQLGAKFCFAERALVQWRPRNKWRSVGKQFFNYARGNGRIGFAKQGYITNLKYHAMIIAPLLAGLFSPWLALLAIYPSYTHIRHNLWPQARLAAKVNRAPLISLRVLLVMEFVRLAGMTGYIRGELDRLLDPSFRQNQKQWMGVDSLDTKSGK